MFFWQELTVRSKVYPLEALRDIITLGFILQLEPMSNSVAIFSFFSGAGFLDLGFENAGFDVRFVNEYVPTFMRSYSYARQQMGISAPIYGQHENSMPEFLEGEPSRQLGNFISDARSDSHLVGFIAGPPCPDFSVAGKNRGHEGRHGQLTSAYFNLVIQQRPDFFVFENVKGLWSTAKHKAYYDSQLARLNLAGYATTDRLVNSLEYGAAQDRNRIILIGFNREVFGDVASDFPWDEFTIADKTKIMQLPWPTLSAFSTDSELAPPVGISMQNTCQYWFDKNDVLNHPNAQKFFVPHAVDRFRSIDEGNTKGKSFKRLHRWRYSPTCAYGNNEVHLHPYKERRISAAEALALQSLPASFVLPPDMPLSAMFKVIGNGVPYKVAEGVAKSISQHISRKLFA